MLVVIACIVSILTYVHGDTDCVCDVHHVETLIYRCPDGQIPYATMHTHDYDYIPLRRKQNAYFTSDVHCRPLVSVSILIPGWLGVEVNGTIGFVEQDEGIQMYKCQSSRKPLPNLSTTQYCKNVVNHFTSTSAIPSTTSSTSTTTSTTTSSTAHPTTSSTTTSSTAQPTTPSTKSTLKAVWKTIKTKSTHQPVTILPTTSTMSPVWRTIQTHRTTGNYKVTFQIPQTGGICDDFKVKNVLKKNITIHHPSARTCQTGLKSQSEAAIFVFCHAPDISRWNKGKKVKGNCNNIPLYTPVSPFVGSYLLGGDGASILTACLPSGGFKIARQTCKSQHLVEVDITMTQGGDILTDPDMYYVFSW